MKPEAQPDPTSVFLYVSRMLTEFHWLIDNRQNNKIAELYAEDAVVAIDAMSVRLNGRKEIDDFYRHQTRFMQAITRHFWSNLRIELEGDMVNAEANFFTIFRPAAGDTDTLMIRVGRSTDRIMFAGLNSKFKSRSLTIQFEGPLGKTHVL